MFCFVVMYSLPTNLIFLMVVTIFYSFLFLGKCSHQTVVRAYLASDDMSSSLLRVNHVTRMAFMSLPNLKQKHVGLLLK